MEQRGSGYLAKVGPCWRRFQRILVSRWHQLDASNGADSDPDEPNDRNRSSREQRGPERAARAYDKYQHCGLPAAQRLFTTGW